MSRKPEPLEPCYSVAQSGSTNTKAVHVRSPRDERLTCCGRTVPAYGALGATQVTCRDCRMIATAIADRRSRGLPDKCWVLAETYWRSRRRVLCEQPVEGHRPRPDRNYDTPWHDGVELTEDWADDED